MVSVCTDADEYGDIVANHWTYVSFPSYQCSCAMCWSSFHHDKITTLKSLKKSQPACRCSCAMCWSSFHHDNDGDDENDSSLTINWRNSLQPADVHARCAEVWPRHLRNPRSLPLHPHGNSCSGLNLEFWLWTNSPCFICELFFWQLFMCMPIQTETHRMNRFVYPFFWMIVEVIVA